MKKNTKNKFLYFIFLFLFFCFIESCASSLNWENYSDAYDEMEQGNTERAISKMKKIPSDSVYYEQAKKRIKEWEIKIASQNKKPTSNKKNTDTTISEYLEKHKTLTSNKVKETNVNNSMDSLNLKGSYYALVIGINNYQYLDKLKTAEKDAIDVENILKSSYGFKTTLLVNENATRKNILLELNKFVKQLGQDDKLLVYYAGHGYFDKEADKSYWLPVDASGDENTEWIIADSITSNFKKISSKQILLVSDSCYSGTLARGLMINNLKSENDRINYLNNLMTKEARVLISSGGDEPVADGGGDGHSIFAKVFIDSLTQIDSNYFTAQELFINYIKEKVAGKSDQMPQYNIIKNSGHNDGDFIFVRSK